MKEVMGLREGWRQAPRAADSLTAVNIFSMINERYSAGTPK